MKLSDEQLGVLSKADINIYNLYGGDTLVSRTIRILIGNLATALLARQRDRRRLGKLAAYAVHQATCTAVLSMTDHCSCGLHNTLREGGDATK